MEGLKELVFKDSYQNLGEYLHCFQYTCAVLRDMDNLERAAYELAIDNQLEGVNYIEVRFAPQLLIDLPTGIDFDRVMHAVNNGLKRGFALVYLRLYWDSNYSSEMDGQSDIAWISLIPIHFFAYFVSCCLGLVAYYVYTKCWSR